MERKILLISDSLEVREEALAYSLSLAKRTDSLVVLLVLLDADKKEAGDEEMKGIFDSYQRKFKGEDVYLESWLRKGNPLSEFLKFIAGTGSYQAIIWGGKEEVNFKKSSSGNEHWLKKAAALAHSPLFAPYKK